MKKCLYLEAIASVGTFHIQVLCTENAICQSKTIRTQTFESLKILQELEQLRTIVLSSYHTLLTT